MDRDNEEVKREKERAERSRKMDRDNEEVKREKERAERSRKKDEREIRGKGNEKTTEV